MKCTSVATWVAAALLACTASAFADEPFALYDANGARMGRFLPFDTVQLTVNGQQYMVPVNGTQHGKSTAALDFNPSIIRFESSDCTGPRLTDFTHPYGTAFAVIQIKPSGRVMLYPGADQAKRMTTQSFHRGNGECQLSRSKGLVVKIQDPIDITDLYARPFTVQ